MTLMLSPWCARARAHTHTLPVCRVSSGGAPTWRPALICSSAHTRTYTHTLSLSHTHTHLARARSGGAPTWRPAWTCSSAPSWMAARAPHGRSWRPRAGPPHPRPRTRSKGAAADGHEGSGGMCAPNCPCLHRVHLGWGCCARTAREELVARELTAASTLTYVFKGCCRTAAA